MISLFLMCILFVVSLLVLLKGSDVFVISASKIAKYFGISEFVIGLTLVAIGTSLPELASSVTAAFKNHTNIIIGNILGSNIANIGFILGIATLSMPLVLNKKLFLNESIFLVFLSFVFYILVLDGELSRIEGLLFLFSFLVYSFIKLRTKTRANYETFKKTYFGNQNNLGDIIKNGFKEIILFKNIFFCIIGVILVFFGAKYLIFSLTSIAKIINISEEIIALTILSLGTTVPELSVTLTAAKKKLSGIAVGNIIGSCITNILLILGISAFINPIKIANNDLLFNIPVMILLIFSLFRFIKKPWYSKISEGIFLLFFYVLFFIITIISAIF